MTREERTNLIKHLQYNRSIGADYSITDKDADEIIKALEQEDVLDKIREEIEALEEGMTSYHDDRPWIFKDEALEIIDRYKTEGE